MFFGRMGGKYPYTNWQNLNLDWILSEVNRLADEWAEYHTTWDEWKGNTDEAFQNLYNYVHDYFDNLDLADEVNRKINEMAASGELAEIIQPLFDEYKAQIAPIIEGQNQEIQLLNARVDGITSLPEGSTTGDAELIDGRITYNGITYPNIGSAIRAQAKIAEKDILNLGVNDYVVTIHPTFEQGNIVNGEDSDTSVNYRVRSVGLTPTTDADFILVDRSLKLWRTYVVYYDSEGQFIDGATGDFSSELYTINKEYAYFRTVSVDRTNSSWSNRIYPYDVNNDYSFVKLSKTHQDIETIYSNLQAQAYLGGGANFNFARSGNSVTLNFSGATTVIRISGTTPNVNKEITFEDLTTAAVAAGWSLTEDGNGIIAPGPSCGLYYDMTNDIIEFRASQRVHRVFYDWIILFENHYNSYYGGLLVEYATTKQAFTPIDINTDTIPDYYTDHIQEKLETITNNMMNVGKNGETFIFITDIHWENNMKNSPALINYLLDNTNINVMLCGGDLINQGTREKMVPAMRESITAFQHRNIFMPCAFGNHDSNWNNWDHQQEYPERYFDRADQYALMQKQAENIINYITPEEVGWNFYFDRPITKTRFIVIDTGENGTFDQFAALANCLNETPEDYSVVIMGHWLFGATDPTTSAVNLMAIADANNAKTSVTINETTYSFANAQADVKLILCGHRHKDQQTTSPGGIPLVMTDSDNGPRSGNTDYPYQKGTITEQAFDVITMDYTNDIIKIVRVGRGVDREITA